MRILASILFGLLPIASHCLDAARTTLARRGVLARALAAPAAALAVAAPSAAHAGIADQLEAASRASEITYSQNGSAPGVLDHNTPSTRHLDPYRQELCQDGRRRQFNGFQEEHFLGTAGHETSRDHGLQIWQGPGAGALRR